MGLLVVVSTEAQELFETGHVGVANSKCAPFGHTKGTLVKSLTKLISLLKQFGEVGVVAEARETKGSRVCDALLGFDVPGTASARFGVVRTQLLNPFVR